MPIDPSTLQLIKSSIKRFEGALRGLAEADRHEPARVLGNFELRCSDAAADCAFVFELPDGTQEWDGEALSLVVLKDHVVLIRNGEPWVLAGAAPARFKNLSGNGRVVFIELGLVHPKATSSGFVECPPVH